MILQESAAGLIKPANLRVSVLAFPHREDYSRAQVPLLPVLTGICGVLYLGGAVVLGAGFLYYAVRLMNPPNEQYAMKVSAGYSITYLMALFDCLLLDHWLVAPIDEVGMPLQQMG